MDPFEDKIILITGGTGTFGYKFVELLLEKYNPWRIRIFSRSELLQVQMEKHFSDKRLRFMIGDIADEKRLSQVARDVDIIVHAAALKHVPVAEYNPTEAIKTNIIGTMNVVNVAIDRDVERAFLLSSDKGCYPTNLYGGTKFIAEKLFIQGNAMGRIPSLKRKKSSKLRSTRFAASRFGNVIGSRGSVIPLFLAQAKKGKIMITDKRMTRFWITQENAGQFVADSIGRMKGGEIFIPKIPSSKLIDIAEIIAPNLPMIETGIRPGEKLHEILLNKEESLHCVEYDDYYIIEPEFDFLGKSVYKYANSQFEYTSDTNTDFLDKEKLRGLINDFIR